MQKSISTISIIALLCFAWVFQVSVARADHDLAREPLPKSWKLDAELTDVFFLNANLGWAVGAQGVIVRTIDGGKTWNEISQVPDLAASDMSFQQKLQNMRAGIQTRSTGVANNDTVYQPIRCRFDSVCFVDANNGWVAGGYKVPYVERSRAVMMQTRDGGVTWKPIKNLVVPRFNKIHFDNARDGWAIGQAGNLFQSGIFFTNDSGLSWSSKNFNSDQGQELTGWIDGAKTKSGFVSIDYEGRLKVIRDNQTEPAVILRKPDARVCKLEMIDKTTGWAVGDAGTILRTENGGLSWSPVETSELEAVISQFDLKTVSNSRTKTWFAGNPGTFLFCFDQTSGNITAHQTPISASINNVHFIDDQTGWGVGNFGTIIATTDGGQTWQTQRGENQRSSILCVTPKSQALPFEILAKYATEENRICSSLILGSSRSDFQIATQAMDRLGLVTSDLVEVDPTSVDQSSKHLEQVVRSIRTLKPNVVVCNSGHVFSSSNANPMANPVTLLKEAVRMAADSNSFPSQLTDLNLKQWQVSRLAILDQTGTISVDPSRLLPRTGVLVEDQIAVSRALMNQSIVVDQPLKYHISHFTNRDRMKAGDLLSGLDPRNQVPMRDASNSKRGNLTMIQRANEKNKKFEQFAKFEVNTPQDLQVWRQQVQTFAMSMEKEIAGVWMMQLAERYLAMGKTELAANASTLLVSTWPDHAFTPANLAWLAQYYASDEFGQIELMKRVKSGQLERSGEITEAEKFRNKFATQPQKIQHNGTAKMVWLPTQAMLDTKVKSSIEADDSEFQPLDPSDNLEVNPNRPTLFEDRMRLASHFLSRLGNRDPELVAGSEFKFLKAQISRRMNGLAGNEGLLKSLVQRRDFRSTGFSLGAQREMEIGGLATTGNSKPLINCRPTTERPKLDGRLDESFWQTALTDPTGIQNQAPLTLDPNAPADRIMLAYDDEFLYAAIVCQKIQGQYYNARKQARPRDANLSRRDRVELSIDVDRDYRSTNQFVIDHRGWVNESCTGSSGWNPEWYVSQSENESSWTVEAAIPLNQLLPGSVEPDSTWAIRVARFGFHEQNLWANPSKVEASLASTVRSGFQVGLRSRPTDFELVSFVGNENGNEVTGDVQQPISDQAFPMTTESTFTSALPAVIDPIAPQSSQRRTNQETQFVPRYSGALDNIQR
jgi:photosystem II stability/assembly factor-like uncharacterized protein